MYTSLKLSKLLADNGFEGESEYGWSCVGKLTSLTTLDEFHELCDENETIGEIGYDDEFISAYDILNDLCVKFGKEMFGVNCQGTKHEEIAYGGGREVLGLLQQNKQDEAENYIIKHCLFNPNNK